MAANTHEIEKLAYNNYKMPDGLDFPEQMLFTALRFLYLGHRYGHIDKANAMADKNLIMRKYETYRLWGDIFKQSADVKNRLSFYITDISKNGCEHCKKAVAIFNNTEKGPEHIIELIKAVQDLIEEKGDNI